MIWFNNSYTTEIDAERDGFSFMGLTFAALVAPFFVAYKVLVWIF